MQFIPLDAIPGLAPARKPKPVPKPDYDAMAKCLAKLAREIAAKRKKEKRYA